MTRALKHGILTLPKYKHFDTLKKAKYHFNFNSNKLDYIATFLGLGSKYKHSGMKMWDDIILYDLFKQGTKEDRVASMNEMLYYNMIDVALTEEVYQRLRLYSTHETHHGVMLGKPKFTCPNDGSENVELIKTVVTAAGTIKKLMKCNDCGQQYYISNSEYLKFINQ
jgi:DNA polymerase III epsilon subunit-like protein